MSQKPAEEEPPVFSSFIRRVFGYACMLDVDEDIEAFALRRGDLDLPAFLRAFHEGQGEDRLVGLFALACSEEVEVSSLVLPLLESANPFERWASAIALGKVYMDQTLPVLIHMLTEVPAVDEEKMQMNSTLFDYWRMSVVYLLREVKSLALVPVFREAVVKMWHLAQDPNHVFENIELCFDSLTYALGSLGAFGAFLGLPFSEKEFHVAMVHLACGAIDSARYYGRAIDTGRVYEGLHGMFKNADFRVQVEEVLEQKCGLAEMERKQCIENLYHNALRRFGRKPPDLQTMIF